MNAVFGIGGWGFEEIAGEIVTNQTEKGTSSVAITQVKVWLKNISFSQSVGDKAGSPKAMLGMQRRAAKPMQ